jgi:Na+-translocating ferredoxin:NAD+ oxidoreductase subunit B
VTKPRPALKDRLNAALPQTQCTRCGYPDCAAYADAIALQGVPINQCPPGGAEGIARLSAITGQPALALNPANGAEGPRAVAVIDEAWCIGCTLCLDACPTDAIFGSNKLMHTVIEMHCTGCELCIPVCPVDCISLENVTGKQTAWAAWSEAQAETALSRYTIHSARRTVYIGQSPERLEKSSLPASVEPSSTGDQPEADAALQKRAVIDAALTRARSLREKQR